MSIKQGEYLKELRTQKNLSQEKLGEILGVSRQSVSKWEQGYAVPETENLIKLSKLYDVSVDSILNCENKDDEAANQVADDVPEKEKKKKISIGGFRSMFAKQSWFFWCYPFLMIIAYILIGFFVKNIGWSTGWIVFLTIPVYYSAVIARQRKNPLLFAYPFITVIVFLIFGFLLQMWHPMWIVFLSIPVYYIIAFSKRISK